jgi:KipI family sensor histidine kinase inhibitor
LVELDGSAEVTAAYRALRRAVDNGELTGVGELVPAARTVLVAAPDPAALDSTGFSSTGPGSTGFSSTPGSTGRGPATHRTAARGPSEDAVRAVLAGLDAAAPDAEPATEVEIPVRYDGEDLELVARTAGLDVEEVVRLHSGATYTVAFCGFAPGFGYLTGLPEQLHQARLDDPRARVPTGSVAVAGEYSAVYPRSSPGGWRLIGRTELTLFDPAADRPSRLTPGDRVRFRPC